MLVRVLTMVLVLVLVLVRVRVRVRVRMRVRVRVWVRVRGSQLLTMPNFKPEKRERRSVVQKKSNAPC